MPLSAYRGVRFDPVMREAGRGGSWSCSRAEGSPCLASQREQGLVLPWGWQQLLEAMHWVHLGGGRQGLVVLPVRLFTNSLCAHCQVRAAAAVHAPG